MLVIPGITRRADDMAGERTAEQCRGARHDLELVGIEGITPGEGAVVGILHRGIVVDRHPQHQVVAEGLHRGHVGAEIGVIEHESVVEIGIGELDESAGVAADAAGDEAADLIEGYVVVVVIVVRHLIGRIVLADIGERPHRHG